MRGLRERTSLAFAINGRTRAREDWQEHAGILAAVIAGDAELAALLATRHVQNAAAAFGQKTPRSAQTFGPQPRLAHDHERPTGGRAPD